jgi:hypothetical protein
MVALGREEAEYLNAAARAQRQTTGQLSGPMVRAGQREFQVGDEVRALRLRPELGGVAPGTTGVVTAVDAERRRLSIRWPATTAALSAGELRGSALVHAYATTPMYARRHPGPVMALGYAPRIAPGLEPGVVHGLAPGPPAPGRSSAPTALAGLLAELGRAGPAGEARPMVPHEAGRSLSSVVAERNEIAARFGASAPAGASRRRAWVEQHREVILRWAGLEQDILRRRAALGKGAEIMPSRAVLAALGPPPDHDSDSRRAWRKAAEAIEVHRECRGLPDMPLVLDHRHTDELRLLVACRAVDRARSAGLELETAGVGR